MGDITNHGRAARSPILAGIRDGLLATFRISDADRISRAGMFRRVFFNLMQGGTAFLMPGITWKLAERFLSDNPDLSDYMFVFGLGVMATGVCFYSMFCRTEMPENDGSITTRPTHAAGRIGFWLLLAACIIIFLANMLDFY